MSDMGVQVIPLSFIPGGSYRRWEILIPERENHSWTSKVCHPSRSETTSSGSESPGRSDKRKRLELRILGTVRRSQSTHRRCPTRRVPESDVRKIRKKAQGERRPHRKYSGYTSLVAAGGTSEKSGRTRDSCRAEAAERLDGRGPSRRR